MMVISTDGIITLEQRDSREPLGIFVARAIASHGIRLRSCSGQTTPGGQTTPVELDRDEPRRAVFELRGCGYQ